MSKKTVLLVTFSTLLVFFIMAIPAFFQKEYSFENSLKPGWKKYTNHVARYSIQFPEDMSIVIKPKKTNSDGFSHGTLTLYRDRDSISEKETSSNNLTLVYAMPYLDGKGGGCAVEDRMQLTVNGTTYDVCITEQYLGCCMYLSHPLYKTEVWIHGDFTDAFPKEQALEIIETFQFIK